MASSRSSSSSSGSSTDYVSRVPVPSLFSLPALSASSSSLPSHVPSTTFHRVGGGVFRRIELGCLCVPKCERLIVTLDKFNDEKSEIVARKFAHCCCCLQWLNLRKQLDSPSSFLLCASCQHAAPTCTKCDKYGVDVSQHSSLSLSVTTTQLVELKWGDECIRCAIYGGGGSSSLSDDEDDD